MSQNECKNENVYKFYHSTYFKFCFQRYKYINKSNFKFMNANQIFNPKTGLSLQESLIDLYLNVKIRSNDEVHAHTDCQFRPGHTQQRKGEAAR